MFKVVHVQLNERAVVFKHSLPFRAFGPGRHWLWGNAITVLRYNVTELVFRALPEVRAMLASDWYREVTVAPLQRAVLFRDGVPLAFLRPGVHRYWTVDASVT